MSNNERLAAAVATHHPIALAIDVNLYQSFGFRMSSPPFTEVGHLGIAYLAPEFWRRELHKHMVEWVEKRLLVRKQLEAWADWGTPEGSALANQLLLASSESAVEIVNRLLQHHDAEAKTVILPTAWSEGPKVLDQYFNCRPPFEASREKKQEFPDAFALTSLEDWARRNHGVVVVASSDRGVIAGCKESTKLMPFEDLAEAIGTIRAARADKSSTMAALSERFRKLLVAGSHPLVARIRDEISLKLQGLEIVPRVAMNVPQWQVESVTVESVDLKGLDLPAKDVPGVVFVGGGRTAAMFAWWFDAELEVVAVVVSSPLGALHNGTLPMQSISVVRRKRHRARIQAIATVSKFIGVLDEALNPSDLSDLLIGQTPLYVDLGPVGVA